MRPSRFGIPIAKARLVLRTALLLSSLVSTLAADAAVWGSRGVSHAFTFLGDTLYVADGRGVSVYDVANAAAPRRIDVEAGDDESHDVALSGSDLLVLATAGGIEWFSVAGDGTLTRRGSRGDEDAVTDVAATPSLVAAGGGKSLRFYRRIGDGLQGTISIRTRSPVADLLWVGQFLYVAYTGGGVAVIDPTTGETLHQILSEARSLALDGDLVWLARGQSGVNAYDVSDPRRPQVVASRIGALEIEANEVAAAGGLLFVRDGRDLVRVYDVENPADAHEVSRVEEWVHVIAARENELFLAGTIYDHEGLPFATGIPFRIFDVTDATQPRVAGQFQDLAGPLSGVFTNGSVAYVVDPPFFRTIDVSRTAEPREMAWIAIPGIQDHVKVKNGLAIVYGRSDVNLIDVSDPWKPRLLSTWDAEGHPPSSAALLRDTFVEANEHSGLHIVDYTNPAKPYQIAGRIFHYHDVAAGDDVVYALQQDTFLVLDVTDRTKVVDRQVWTPTHYLQVDTIPPNSAYPPYLVTSRHHGIEIWTLADRFEPKRIAMADLMRPGIFGTSESAAFVSNGRTLLRVDISGAVFDTELRVTSPMQISAAGEKIVVADRYGLRVYGPDTAPPPPAPPVPPARRRVVGR